MDHKEKIRKCAKMKRTDLPLVRTAKLGRDIIAIDGCPLSCCKSCLARHEVQPKHHFTLFDFDVPKMPAGINKKQKDERLRFEDVHLYFHIEISSK
ncbi:putative zinc-binding protein [Paenibacillus sp. Lou8.1]|uniref:putative zinc-binding protein n=1 Tax=Paenibacillus sp. Lou8.1 TaxID=2962041 RepID=UPI00349F8DFB